MTWPAEYGGQGLGPLHQVVVNQEIGRAGVPGIFDVIGVGMLGPTIIAHGDEDQKQRHIGSMLAADEVWCQLFSEPAAGSDLAGNPVARAAGGGRRLAAVRPEGVDHERAARGLRPAAGAHRRRRAQAQGPDDVHRADGRRGRHRAPAAADLRRGALQRGVLRRRAAAARQRGRARQRRLGRRDDHADVRARGDRPRRRGLRLARRPLRLRAGRRRARRSATARSATASARSPPSSWPCASSAIAR